MKNIKLLLFTIFICLVSINGVSAAQRLTCKYQQAHNTYEVIYNINGDVVLIDKIYQTTDYVTDSEVTDLYRNWFQVDIHENGDCKNSIYIQDVGNLKLIEHSKEESTSQCYNYKTESTCKNSTSTGKVSCVWNENESAPKGGYCNVDNLLFVSCGDAYDIPSQVPSLIAFFINLLKIATPIILIFVSIMTLVKALAASKEDEIKKAQTSLVKKIIAAVLVFFVISIVQFIISKVALDDEENNNFSDCLNCFLNNNCEDSTYYKTNVLGTDECTSLTTGDRINCE